MKKILYTQRVEIVQGYNERRDCADQQIAEFLWGCGFLPVPVNNLPKYVAEYAAAMQPIGIVLTGGNDLAAYGGNAPERDETEVKLIELALRNNIPVLGFCRGMQMLAHYFGGGLKAINNHVAKKHLIRGSLGERMVNSYHNYAVAEVPAGFEALASSVEDGVVEAMRHKQQRLLGIMWHPEREAVFQQADIDLFKEFFA